ncbi:MAG: nicotinate phosphoribosyltransferase [Candidatus Asgardarchaeia archaeon]
MPLHIATDKEIVKGKTTDIYFLRTLEILKKYKLDNVHVVAEITASSLPDKWPWGVFVGLEELIHILEGKNVNVYAMPEGTIFYPNEPVVKIEGPYGEFAIFETPALGVLCQASGVATRAARIRKIVRDKILLSFGIRRMHPAIAPMIDRAAVIGGFDGYSGIAAEKFIGIPPAGTMPHALILIFGKQKDAWLAFDETLPNKIPRIALVDTLWDEKFESIEAAETLKDRLYGVRLDTPGSRRGNFKKIIEEVRWELDIRGFKHVKIFVSGGINEESVKILKDAPVDGFGIGTYIANAPTVDYAMDIVEKEGKPIAKRGKFSGSKQVWKCEKCGHREVTLFNVKEHKCSKCGSKMIPLLRQVIKNGKVVVDLPKVTEIREYVLKQLDEIEEL